MQRGLAWPWIAGESGPPLWKVRGDDAGVGAEGVKFGKAGWLAEFPGEAGGEDEADAGYAREHDVGGGGQQQGCFGTQLEGGFGEGCERAFGAVEEAGEEFFGEGVNAVGSGGLLAHEGAAAAGEIPEMTVSRVHVGGLAGDSGAAGEQGFGDTEQIESVGAGKEVFTVFLGFVGIYPHDEIAFEAQCLGEVGHIRGLVLAAEKDLVLGDFPMTGGGGDFLEQMLDASGVVFDGKGGFEDVAVAVADQGEVLALGVVEGDAENFSGISSTLEKGADE